jgi:hypothetical protein
VFVLAAVCAFNIIRILSSSRHGSNWGLGSILSPVSQDLGFAAPHARTHPRYVARIPGVYPYSVVPGGVRDVGALKAAAARDRAVARHFSHFDFDHARLERLRQAREVYVSYRIRDTIFWTRRRIRLPAGELLLTDGKIAARAKCGNQVSDTAKPEVSNEEPEESVMEQPVEIDAPPPFPMRASVSQPDLPVGPSIAQVYGGGFSFPYAPITAGPPIGVCLNKEGKIDKKCGGHHGGSPVPEPGTMVLLGSGLGMLVWRYRLASPRHPARA